MKDLKLYTSGLVPWLDDVVLAPETISRAAYYRENLEQAWAGLTFLEKKLIKEADRVLVENAATIGPFYPQDQAAITRHKEEIPLDRWWWWVDRIGDNTFPVELLPEWVK